MKKKLTLISKENKLKNKIDYKFYLSLPWIPVEYFCCLILQFDIDKCASISESDSRNIFKMIIKLKSYLAKYNIEPVLMEEYFGKGVYCIDPADAINIKEIEFPNEMKEAAKEIYGINFKKIKCSDEYKVED